MPDQLGTGLTSGLREEAVRKLPAYDKGQPIKQPDYPLGRLRARARVCMTMKQWHKVLAAAGRVVQRQLTIDGGLGVRTNDSKEPKALRDGIKPHPSLKL